ncbi:MAG: CRISPR-associated endonuclease Cas1 [Halochromatium sp.]
MSTLYLDRRDLRLELSGQTLALYADDHREGTVPVHLLERIVMRSNVHIGSSALARLADQGVSIAAFGGRMGEKLAIIHGHSHNDGARRIGQYRRYDDLQWQQRWAYRLVLLKLRRQRRLLSAALSERADQRHALLTAVNAIEALITRLRVEPAMSPARLRGIEGAAAAAYFRGFTALFAASLDFTGRNRRPPRDPVNAVLSLGYTLLHAEAVRACYGAGLDPIIGYYHRLQFGRESLASDLIEPLRPTIDHFAWEQFRAQALRAEDFACEGGACLLSKSARGSFFSAFEPVITKVRQILRRATRRLARDFAVVGARGVSSVSEPM